LFHEFKINSTESTKLLIFKLSKNVVEKEHKGLGGEDIGVPGFLNRMHSKKFNEEVERQASRNSRKSRSNTV
jgi:hypothetical protein